jgi:hypothetical protein
MSSKDGPRPPEDHGTNQPAEAEHGHVDREGGGGGGHRGMGDGRGGGRDVVDKFKASWRVNQAVEVRNPKFTPHYDQCIVRNPKP